MSFSLKIIENILEHMSLKNLRFSIIVPKGRIIKGQDEVLSRKEFFLIVKICVICGRLKLILNLTQIRFSF